MNILAELRSRFDSALATFTDETATFSAMVKLAQDAKFGDFQANCAMPLAKQCGKNPRELAAELVEKLSVSDLCHEPEVAGPGFINLRLRDDWLESSVNELIDDERLGHSLAAKPRTYAIDFSGPNIAKPMHVGHLRSTVIGDALCRILKFSGHKVIGDNHIGDWGTQFGMIIFGYKTFLDQAAYEDDPVNELARLYRLVNQIAGYHSALSELPRVDDQLSKSQQLLQTAESEADANDKQARKATKKIRREITDLQERVAAMRQQISTVEQDSALKARADQYPDIAAAARNETAKLHSGDAENRKLWDQFVPKCLSALDVVYQRMNVQIDVTLGESFYQPMLADVVAELEAKGIASESEGAVCVFIKGNDAPFIIRKQDGAFTYATTDLATIKHRHNEFQADAMLYVVDARQAEHFGLLFEASRRWGFDSTEFKHVVFGSVLGNDGKPFKTRSGDTVGLESLLDESIGRARRIVDENDDAKPDGPELDDAARAAVAEIVGIGGIKYADLNHNRESDYLFSWDKMLATNGDTATYIQYAIARIFGIFRRGDVDPAALRHSGGSIRLGAPQERALGFQLLRFAEAIDDVALDYRPNLLTQYLFETANCFNAFHRDCHVLKAEDNATRISRLLLCDLAARVLTTGLSLLGIESCEQM